MPLALQELIERIGGQKRAMAALVGLVTVVAILGLSHWATRPSFVPVFTGLPLETIGQVTAKLDEESIPYQLEQGGGTVLVASEDLARARVMLAGSGLPSSGRPGLELFDQPSWGMTDFAQRINYRRALEGELERTISKMSGVETAKVHLAMHETSSFRAIDRPSEASVVLKLRTGMKPANEVVQGIAHLVASSVDGLESTNVAVLDEAGRLLSSPHEAGSIAALSSQQLGMQREVEQYLETKAEQILSQIVGAGNARVQVAASINFDRVERTTERVDPEQQAIQSEQRSEIVPGAEGGAGSSNVTAQYENSRSVETFSGAPGNLSRLTVAVLVNDRLLPPPADADAEAEGAPAPPSYQPRTAEELARIEMLVRSAVGVDTVRGDQISVVSVPFDAVAPLAIEAPSAIDRVAPVLDRYTRPALGLIGVVLAFVFAMRVLRSVGPPVPSRRSPDLMLTVNGGGAGGTREEDDAPMMLEGGITMNTRRTVPVVNTVMRDRVVASVEEHPQLAARLVRAWMKDS